VREQEVNRRRVELQQGLVGGHRIAADIDRAQDSAVAVAEFRRLKQVQAIGDSVEAVAPVCVATVPPGRFGVAIQADADLDPHALERLEHGQVEESAVGLDGDVHLRGDPGAQ